MVTSLISYLHTPIIFTKRERWQFCLGLLSYCKYIDIQAVISNPTQQCLWFYQRLGEIFWISVCDGNLGQYCCGEQCGPQQLNSTKPVHRLCAAMLSFTIAAYCQLHLPSVCSWPLFVVPASHVTPLEVWHCPGIIAGLHCSSEKLTLQNWRDYSSIVASHPGAELWYLVPAAFRASISILTTVCQHQISIAQIRVSELLQSAY